MSVNVALLGAGRIGKVHAKAVDAVDGAHLVAVADAIDEAARSLAGGYEARVSTIDSIAAADDVDAVIICTPTNMHADLIEQFARAGKAVFCEKPIDLSLERTKTCLRTVEESGAVLMLGFNRRFDPHFRAVREAIDAGRIGDVEMVHVTSRDPGPPPPSYIQSSGGLFRDMTIHDFDMARFLLGEEITTVYATASVLVDPEIGKLGDYDSATIVLTTASGKQCSISNSRRASYGYDQRIEVHGSKGAVTVENQRPVAIEVATAEGSVRPPLHDFFMTRYTEAYAAEIAAFVHSIETKSPPHPTGEDGLKALMLAEAALKSVAERRSIGVDEI